MRIFWVGPMVVLLAAVGCGYGSTRSGEWDSRATEEPTEAAIQTGAELTDIGEGEGVGAFVEYEAGGTWSVTLACDTLFSGIACEWDVFATPARDADGQLAVWTKELDRGDVAHDNDLGGVTVQTVTAYELDFVSIAADPGATIELEVRLDAYYLDRDPAPERFVYWVGDNGVLHSGAPSNPIKLRPSMP